MAKQRTLSETDLNIVERRLRRIFLTKDEFKKFKQNSVTKDEFGELRQNVVTKDEFGELREDTVTKVEFGELREDTVTKVEFRDYRSELLNKLDQILGEILASREEQTVMSGKISEHEERLVKLEHSTPMSQCNQPSGCRYLTFSAS